MSTHIKPVAPTILAADRATLRALQGLVDYQPLNGLYSTPQLTQLEATLTQAELAIIRAQEALDQALAVRAETSHMFHNAIQGAKEQVIAQYGNNSVAVEMIGLRRKSTYRRPSRHVAEAK